MKKIILIFICVLLATSCVAQTKHPKKKKSTTITAVDSTINRAVKAAIDSLKAHGYIKD